MPRSSLSWWGREMLTEKFKAARRASVPIIAITTPDAIATVAELSAATNGKATVKIQWDYARGFMALSESAKTIVGDLGDYENNPFGCLIAAAKLPEKAVLFVHLANRWIVEPSFIQALSNLRDQFKVNGRTVVLLGPELTLPSELTHDVVSFDEPLPGAAELRQVIEQQIKAAGEAVELPPETSSDATIHKAIEAVRGLSRFSAEQIVAMSLSRMGLDVDSLWERKRQQIEQTPGLKVFRDGDSFSQIGGVSVVKSFVSRVMKGDGRPNAVVFVDEIEKSIGGAKGDTSGVGQDQLGCLLSYMQDHSAAGMIFVGPPGAAKSAVAKAAGNEGGVPTIQLDLGAAKGSLVGQSEQQLRQALKVITAVSNGRSLWIATCNSIAELPPELRRRFTLGTFFFDLPDEEERRAIWKIWSRKLLSDVIAKSQGCSHLHYPDDQGWTGAEIRQCCDIAWRLGCPLNEAAGFIVPVARSAAEQIERLRTQADGRFLSASQSGVYTRKQATAVVNQARSYEMEE